MIPATFQSPRRISTRLQSRLAILTEEVRGTGVPLNVEQLAVQQLVLHFDARLRAGSEVSGARGADTGPALASRIRGPRTANKGFRLTEQEIAGGSEGL